MATSTPWGKSDYSHQYTRGLTFYGTPTHGGFKVSEKLNQQIPEYMRRTDGWYEEDCDGAIVIVTHPLYFSEKELQDAIDTMRNWHPDAYEKFYGVTIEPGKSLKRDEQQFLADHANDFIVIAAWGDWHEAIPHGMVGVLATIGGRHDSGNIDSDSARFFLVPAAEYGQRNRFGFVIDLAKHPQVKTEEGKGW